STKDDDCASFETALCASSGRRSFLMPSQKLRHPEERQRARLEGRTMRKQRRSGWSMLERIRSKLCRMGRVNLLRAVALSSALVVSGAAFAAELEPAGPPLSAAPPRPPSPRPQPSPPQRPRSAEAAAAAYERCMTLAGEDPSAARDFAERWQDRGGAHPADHCY